MEFLVQGSSENQYVVVLSRKENRLFTSCNCSAGQNKQHCKHRISLLEGNLDNVIRCDSDVDQLQLLELVRGTDVEVAITEMRSAEKSHLAAQAHLKQVKKALDRVLNK